MTIADHYKAIPYIDGGRTPAGADCWGLVRLVLMHSYGVPDLPEWGGIFDGQHREMHGAFIQQRGGFIQQQQPQPGDVVCVFSPEGECAHVGIVVPGAGGLLVLHTRARHGVSTMPVDRFARHYNNRIEFWRYAHNQSIQQ